MHNRQDTVHDLLHNAVRQDSSFLGDARVNTAQLEEELHAYEEQHSSGAHNIKQQLKQGLFTRNPRAFETLVYFIFVGMFLWLCLSTQGGSKSYDLTANIRDKLADFVEVSDSGSWFKFMEDTLPEILVPSLYYNGQELESEHLGNVAGEFMLLGSIAARQLRVKNLTCNIDKDDLIYPSMRNCFGDYSKSTESREPYGPARFVGSNSTKASTELKFEYSTAKDLGCKVGCSTVGWLATYQGGGYQVQLPSFRNHSVTDEFTNTIRKLKQNRWLDRQTRAVFVEFSIYSLPSKLIAVVQLWYETNSKGTTKTYIQVLPMKIGHIKLAETSTLDMVAEFGMLVMTVIYTAQILRQWYQEGFRAYFGVAWNCMGLLNNLLFYVAFAFRYAALFNAAGIPFPPPLDTFVYMSASANQILGYKYVMGFNSILTFLRIFKLLGHIPFMARLVNILAASVEDVLSFLLCAMVVLLGYCGAFHLTYGSHMPEFASYNECLMSLYRITHGEWDYDTMRYYQYNIGIFYLVSFSLLAICILMNMFIAIIMEAYDGVRQEEEKVSVMQFLAERLKTKGRVDVVVDNQPPSASANEAVKEAKSAAVASADDLTAGGGPVAKLQQDMELVLAALVDFRRDVKHVSKKIQQLTDNDGSSLLRRAGNAAHPLAAAAAHKVMEENLTKLLRKHGLEDAIDTLVHQGVFNAERLKEIQEEDIDELGLPFATMKVFKKKRTLLLANLERVRKNEQHERIDVTTARSDANTLSIPEPRASGGSPPRSSVRDAGWAQGAGDKVDGGKGGQSWIYRVNVLLHRPEHDWLL